MSDQNSQCLIHIGQSLAKFRQNPTFWSHASGSRSVTVTQATSLFNLCFILLQTHSSRTPSPSSFCIQQNINSFYLGPFSIFLQSILSISLHSTVPTTLRDHAESNDRLGRCQDMGGYRRSHRRLGRQGQQSKFLILNCLAHTSSSARPSPGCHVPRCQLRHPGEPIPQGQEGCRSTEGSSCEWRAW